MKIWLTDRDSGKRIYQLTQLEVLALRAYKRRQANAVQEALCLALIERQRCERLCFECGCRQVGSLCPDFHSRRLRSGGYVFANRPNADVTHAPDCVFRRSDTDADRPPPMHHPNVLGGFDVAEDEEEDRPPPDLHTRPHTYWKPRPRVASEQQKTLWGTASILMQRAGLNLLGAEERRPPPEEWLAAIMEAAGSLYLPPRVPASGYLFTDPAVWRSDDEAARLEKAAADWPEEGPPRAYLCWPVEEVSGCAVDPGREGHVEAARPVICPSIGGRPVIGPYLFLGAITRAADGWKCVNACARPIAALDCPVPVDSDYERQTVGALWPMVRTLAGNREFAALIGGVPRVRLEKPLTLIRTRIGTCIPDFLVSAFRPGTHDLPPGDPKDPGYLQRFDPRNRANYVIEVMGFADRKYEESKKRTHPRMELLGELKLMQGREFDSPDNGIDRQREELTAEIALDLLKRWRRGRAGPAAA